MGGGRWAAAGALLALAAGLLAAGSASEYDYRELPVGHRRLPERALLHKPPQCVDIPADLRLCHNVGYKRMVLPNLLEHETITGEAAGQQLGALLNKNCHIGTQVFLCSLFAPVCLDRPIYPCRWLCEAVRDSCEAGHAVLRLLRGQMLKCDRKFPEGDVCIAMAPPNATEASSPKVRLGSPGATSRGLGNVPSALPDEPREVRWCPAGRPRARTGCGSWSAALGIQFPKQALAPGPRRALFSPGRGASPHRSFEPRRRDAPGLGAGNTTKL